jgi:uncharacterized protein (DUF1501 family)
MDRAVSVSARVHVPMKRRRFLELAGAGALGLGSIRLWALPAGSSGTRFVLVLLRGGYDAASLLVPFVSAFYYESRPNIAIPRPNGGDPEAAVALDSYWGLHPALKDSVFALYQQRQALFVPYAGSEDQSRSHFHAQDVLELGQGYGARVDYGSGFLNRLVERLRAGRGADGVSFTENLPLVFKGNVTVANRALKGEPKNPFNQRQADLLEKMYQGTDLARDVHEGLETRRQMSAELQEEMVTSARGAVNAKGFVQQARRMGRLMAANPNYAVAFVDVGGWDTHVHQGAAHGALSDRLRDLGEGLVGFADELGEGWRNTVLVVISEFGRTFRENGDRGTDHGHGSVVWVLGGAIAGGRIAGEQVGASAGDLFQDRDLVVLNEYRSLLGYVFTRVYGLDRNDMNYVFPGATAGRYSFL